MIIEDIEYKLKDGRTIIIRNPKEEDAQAALDYLYITACETEFILRYPEECGKYTLEGEKKLFELKNASKDELMLVAEIDGKIVGMSDISFGIGMKVKHRSRVAIALVKEFWGYGLGTKMFEIMLEIAKNNPNILQVELEFIEGNSRARALYEKMGFRIVGVTPNAIRFKDGSFHNEYYMVKEIKR